MATLMWTSKVESTQEVNDDEYSGKVVGDENHGVDIIKTQMENCSINN